MTISVTYVVVSKLHRKHLFFLFFWEINNGIPDTSGGLVVLTKS